MIDSLDTQQDYYFAILRVPPLPSSCVVPSSVTTQLLGSDGTALQLARSYYCMATL